MIARTITIAALICLFPRNAFSDGRINFRIDFSRTNVEGAYNDVGLNFQGLEVELEREFTNSKFVLSGFSLGLRRELFYGFTGFGTAKDVRRWDEGTYLMLRMYRTFDVSGDRSWSIGPSFTILYGIPGTTLDRTAGAGYGVAGYDYTHVFPMRNSDVPKLLEQKAEVGDDSALLYPEASLVIRKRFVKGGIVLDWVGGVRIIRFGIVDSNTQGDLFTDRRVFIPSVGMRMGFRIF
jgi:hypothetical protein